MYAALSSPPGLLTVRRWDTDTYCLDAGLRLAALIPTIEKPFPTAHEPSEVPRGSRPPLEMLALRRHLSQKVIMLKHPQAGAGEVA